MILFSWPNEDVLVGVAGFPFNQRAVLDAAVIILLPLIKLMRQRGEINASVFGRGGRNRRGFSVGSTLTRIVKLREGSVSSALHSLAYLPNSCSDLRQLKVFCIRPDLFLFEQIFQPARRKTHIPREEAFPVQRRRKRSVVIGSRLQSALMAEYPQGAASNRV